MTFETALRKRLREAEGLAGASVEWGKRPQGGYPAVVLTIVSDPIGQHMTGLDGWRQPRLQADVFALDNPTKVALRGAYLTTIATSALVDSVRFARALQMRTVDMGEQTETAFIFRDMIEAVVPYQLEN